VALADAVSSASAAWPLNEASGTRADQVGTADLTDNNTVATGTGKVNSVCADFEDANSESLSVADSAPVSLGDIDWMIRCWVKLESKPGLMAIVSKYGGSYLEYLLYYNSGADRFTLLLRDNIGSNIGSVNADNLGSPSTATWYLIHAWHSATSNEVGIAVNAGTANTASTTAAAIDQNEAFRIGANNSGVFYFDGLIDDVVLLKNYILDATERTEDYNGGTGIAFADWGGAPAAGHPAMRRFTRHRDLWLPQHRPIEIGRQGVMVN
jgi:hypothetical protein